MAVQDEVAQLQKGYAFASPKLVDDFLERGKLPTIHDPMGVAMAAVPEDERDCALDLGACHGLLSIRANLMGWRKVIGVDIDQPSVDVFSRYLKPRFPDVELEQATINCLDPSFYPWLSGLRDRGADTILARRIFPELFVMTFGKAGRDPAVYTAAGRNFGQTARDLGFRRIIIEGRLWKGYWNSKSRNNPLFRTEREMAALGPAWRCEARHGECATLVPS